jgi:LDH2 family malate/lactate/ureidoglycolate dehydrogenase
MPDADPDALRGLLEAIYCGTGVPADEAAIVAHHQVEANLVGHDSHGVLRTPTYVELIEEGRIVPGARLEVLEEHPASLLIDGHWGFGFVITERALELGLAKARAVGAAAVSIRRQGHIGRLGAYTARAAEAGMAAMLVADSGRAPKSVAPFGGSDRRLGTNPISIGLPAALEGPVVLDMATSAVAGGKIKVAASTDARLPPGWAIDARGHPADDPAVLASGGALLPLGGDQGHKGYGLSFVVESLAAVLSGIGYGEDPAGFPNDGILLILLNISMFRPLEAFRDELADFARYVKASPPAPGFDEVLYPGELEQRTRAERLVSGIPVPDKVWRELASLEERLCPARTRGQS